MTTDALYDELVDGLGTREATWILEELDGLDDQTRADRARGMARRRRDGEPLQYVLGHWGFRALDLECDRRALIPRPETEQLVSLAVAALGGAGGPRLACDLGCGTGAIALSLATEAAAAGRDLDVIATDVSSDALALARHNAARVGAHRVTFSLGSWFDALPASAHGRVDVLCANPPYVAVSERPTLARELDLEPALALVAQDALGTPGFACVAAVIEGATAWLAPGATLLVEHGASQGRAAADCARRAGLVEVVDHADLAGLPRVLQARQAP